jgi:hypothetical protein
MGDQCLTSVALVQPWLQLLLCINRDNNNNNSINNSNKTKLKPVQLDPLPLLAIFVASCSLHPNP